MGPLDPHRPVEWGLALLLDRVEPLCLNFQWDEVMFSSRKPGVYKMTTLVVNGTEAVIWQCVSLRPKWRTFIDHA